MSDTVKKELVWLPAHLAAKVQAIESDEQLNAIIDKYFKDSVDELKNQLNDLDEQVVQYKGLMAKARQAYTEAANEQLGKSYELWEAIDEKRPYIKNKVDALVADLQPLADQLAEIQKMLGGLHIHRLERALEVLQQINQMPEATKQMFVFLAQNYKQED